MSRALVKASSQYLTLGSAPVTAAPLTISVWLKPASLSSNQHPLRLEKTTDYSQEFEVFLTGATNIVYSVKNGGTQSQPGASFTVATGSWQHFAGVSVSSSSHFGYLSGVASAEGTTSVVPSGINNLVLGRITDLGGVDYYDGLLAEAAIWNVALSAGQIATLAAGGSPMAVATLPIRYWRFKDNLDLTDLVASAVLTNVSTTYSSDNPTVADPPSGVNDAAAFVFSRRRRRGPIL